jgi:hypothetical protein
LSSALSGKGLVATPTFLERPSITDDMINLRALVEKTPDADLLREMISFAADRQVPDDLFDPGDQFAIGLGRTANSA